MDHIVGWCYIQRVSLNMQVISTLVTILETDKKRLPGEFKLGPLV